MKIFCFLFLQISGVHQQLLKLIDDFQQNELTQNCNVSVCIKKIRNDSLTFSYLSNKSMPPASTQKLITTGTALSIYGKDFVFETKLCVKGKIENGVLNGDLIIKTKGDPTFGSSKFNSFPLVNFINALKEQKIKTIAGKIIVESFETFNIPDSWPIGDVGNYYGSFPQQFNYKENSYSVFFNGGKYIGDTASISKILPTSGFWKIKNQVKTAGVGSGDQVNIYNLPFSNDLYFKGTVPLNSKNFEVKGAIPNILDIFIAELEMALKESNIELLKKINADSTIETEIYNFNSPPLSKISETCNFRSVNFFADGISNYLTESHSSRSFDEFLKNYWLKENLNLSSFNFEDGSGLSPVNFISTFALASFLSKMTQNKQFPAFFESIPIVGKSGTVSNIQIPLNSRDKIKAKSGSIASVRNYAGYFLNRKNEMFSFSIFVNGFNDTARSEIKNFYENFFKMITFLD